MKTSALVLALLFSASPVFPQGMNTGQGLQGTKPNNRLSTIPADQFITVVYPFTSLPAASGAGLVATQSTASGVTLNVYPPYLDMLGLTTSRRCRVWESGPLSSNAHIFLPGDESTLAMVVSGVSAFTGVNSWMQIAYGDTGNFVVSKTGTSGLTSYGIIMTGTGNANAAYAPSGKITAYVIANGNDTTYASLGGIDPAVSDPIKLWIHAGPGGGGVEFWINDVLQTTIASPVRSGAVSATSGGWSIWLGGDTGTLPEPVFGPVTIQRAWP